MKRIAYVSPSLTDTCSFYRGFGPLSHIAREKEGYAIQNVQDVNWASLCQADLMHIPRPYNETLLSAISIAKSNRKPIWVDYDDNLFCIPKSNPNYKAFSNKESEIAECVGLSTVVTVSTEALKKTFSTFHQDVRIIPNAYDDYSFGELPEFNPNKQKLVVWRGSPTHDDDLLMAESGIIEVVNSDSFKDWKILFLGYNPIYITSKLKPERVLFKPASDIMEYMAHLKSLNAALMIVPLVDTEFNRAKSNIAWIEATYAGMATLATPLPEFRKPGVIPAESFGNDFKWTIQAINHTPEVISAKWSESYSYIKNNLYLSRVNKLREEIIDECSKVSKKGYVC